MKMNLKFRSLFLTILMVVLIFYSPYATLAEQISVERQAKQDAEADVNKSLWISTGCAVLLLPMLGLLAGSFVPQSSGSSFIGINDQEAWGFSIGCAVGCLGPLTLISMYQQTPPPERFIGKSPEYIDVYTDAYKKRDRSLRVQYTAVGCAIGGGLMILIAQITED